MFVFYVLQSVYFSGTGTATLPGHLSSSRFLVGFVLLDL